MYIMCERIKTHTLFLWSPKGPMHIIININRLQFYIAITYTSIKTNKSFVKLRVYLLGSESEAYLVHFKVRCVLK